jgi:prepilin-type N-terminal cleavage/methylation domain-containing protein
MRLLRPRAESGFTLTELMIAVALLGIGMGWIVKLYMAGWQNWKRNFDELSAQQAARRAMAIMVQAVREGRPGSVAITKPANGPNFSQIAFTDGRWRNWIFRQEGKRLMAVVPLVPMSAGVPLPNGPVVYTTQFLASDVQAVYFTFPSFADMSLVDVGLTIRKYPYQGAAFPIVVQLVERVMLRNP